MNLLAWKFNNKLERFISRYMVAVDALVTLRDQYILISCLSCPETLNEL